MTICIFKTNSVEASSVGFEIMSVDIQDKKCIVEGYFYNNGTNDVTITNVQFYGPLMEYTKLSGDTGKICDINVSFPEYSLVLKVNRKVYETFVVLNDNFKKNLPEDHELIAIAVCQRWDVKCKGNYKNN